MKIVQINACYERGSTGRMAMEMHEEFLSEGHESYVFSPNAKGYGAHIINIGNSVDYKVHSFLSRLFGLQGFFSVISTIMMIKKLKKINPDIVHLHNLHNNFINLPLLFSYLKGNRVATVITLHDCWFFTGHCGYYTSVNCEKWKNCCGRCPAIRTYNKSWFFDNSSYIRKKKEQWLMSLDKLAIIGNSKWTTAQAKQSFLKDAKIISTVYNWIDTDSFRPLNRSECRTKYGYSCNEFIILGIAQGWNNLKGLHIFEEIAKLKPSYRIILVGKMYDQRTLPSNITCVGTVRNKKVLTEYYNLADVYVNPSIQETFGLVTAEALSCGTPVVGNNATATPELICKNVGYVVDNNNIGQFIQCIQKIKDNPISPIVISQWAKHSFSICNIKQYISIYNQLLSSN